MFPRATPAAWSAFERERRALQAVQRRVLTAARAEFRGAQHLRDPGRARRRRRSRVTRGRAERASAPCGKAASLRAWKVTAAWSRTTSTSRVKASSVRAALTTPRARRAGKVETSTKASWHARFRRPGSLVELLHGCVAELRACCFSFLEVIKEGTQGRRRQDENIVWHGVFPFVLPGLRRAFPRAIRGEVLFRDELSLVSTVKRVKRGGAFLKNDEVGVASPCRAFSTRCNACFPRVRRGAVPRLRRGDRRR
ncbi:hypothetical protein DES52_11396 [Deinococcus yavapaiensis KR-236]|uniref:Uncharacterized protein n=1 Tax=Deinococcus yavapaiensis KR-236 TaxID=694435 RepID=A0A318S4Y6_9DEIO|nr:hypothetical protein DES52_11396 [Deinococcus yavapaiensis KR-236]